VSAARRAAPLPPARKRSSERTGSPARPGRRHGQRRRSRAVARRRRLLAGVALLAVLLSLPLGVWGSAPRKARRSAPALQKPGPITLTFQGRQIARIGTPVGPRARGAAAPRTLSSQVSTVLPRTTTVRLGAARVVFQLDAATVAASAAKLLPRGGDVEVPGRPVAASITAPVLKQKLHNNCEAAALQVLLATAGVRADQLRLQAELPRSGPLDPRETGAGRVWGDPNAGFVGRADSGGPAGGFGVYQGPLAGVARRHGVLLKDLSGTTPGRLYAHVLSGHAVLAWVGLADGPFGRWNSPNGRTIEVNFNEHAVVITGIGRDGLLSVIDPLQGKRTVWSKTQFEALWARINKRALST